MKSTAYLSSARVYSILMLLAVYLGFNLATSYARRVSLLQEARHAFAIEYLLTSEDRAAVRQIPGAGVVRANYIELEGNGWVFPTLNEPAKEAAWLLAVTRSTGRQWESLVYESELRETVDERAAPAVDLKREAEPPATNKPPSNNVATPSKALTALRKIAVELGLKDSDQKAYNLILRDIEQEVVDREVTVPGIDLAFRSDLAPWMISILTIGFLLLIRNHVNVVMLDKELALDEPWVIVDNSSGLERLVAEGWLIAIWLAPWIAVSCLLAIVSGGVAADGGIASKLKTTVASIAVSLLVLLGGWASLTATASLLRLRRSRQDRIRKLLFGGSVSPTTGSE